MSNIDFFQLTAARQGDGPNGDTAGSWPVDDGLVFALADGTGADATDHLASSLALEVFRRELGQAAGVPIATGLRRAVQAANIAIHHKAVAVPELARFGTTLTATAVVGRTLWAAHVGDCRLLLHRGATLVQLTKDHRWGIHTPGTRNGSRPSTSARETLARCLGRELIVAIDLLSMEIRAGDTLVHCSDGLHDALAEHEIRELLDAHPPDAACRALVRRARESRDDVDIGVQIARVGVLPAAPARPWWRLGR